MRKTKTKEPERILSRKLAKVLTSEELRVIAGGYPPDDGSGGSVTCCPCADDCDAG